MVFQHKSLQKKAECSTRTVMDIQAVSDAIKQSKTCQDALDTAYEITRLSKKKCSI